MDVNNSWDDEAPATHSHPKHHETATHNGLTAMPGTATQAPETLRSAVEDAPQASEPTPEAETAPKRRGRPKADGSAPAAKAEPKSLEEMSLVGLRKEISKAIAKARAGVEALTEAEKALDVLESKLG